MTLTELIKVLREDYLDDAVTPYLWSDAALSRGLNEAQRQACNRGELIFDKTSAETCLIKLSAGVQGYSLSSKITQVKAVYWNSVRLTHITPDNLDLIYPNWRVADTLGMQGRPLYYVVQGNTISVAPIPIAADAALASIKVECYRLPIDDMGLSDEPEIPTGYHRDLIWWALSEAYSKNDADVMGAQKAQMYLEKFNQVFGPYVSARVRQHQFEQPKSATIRPQNYQGYSASLDDDEWC